MVMLNARLMHNTIGQMRGQKKRVKKQYLAPILGLGAPQDAPEQGGIEALRWGQPPLNLCHCHLRNVFVLLFLCNCDGNTLYLDVEERRESLPGVEQKISVGEKYWHWYWY